MASTVPLGPTDHADRDGVPFAPDMQTGFGSPSVTRYQFGGETRVDTAVVYRVLGRNALRVDVAGELNGLHLQRDRERNDAGAMEPATASGGAILYVGLGLRAYCRRFSAGLGIRRAAPRSLNEQALQQGSEGLEKFRAAFTLSASTLL